MSESDDAERLYRTMRDYANDDRPREKLLGHGAAVLSDAELVAIVLRSGVKGENVLDMARRLLESQGGLAGLIRADVKTLQRVKGLGPAKAAELAAAFELGRRAGTLDPGARPMMDTPEAVHALLSPRVAGKNKEEVYVLALDSRLRLLGSAMVLTGSVSSVSLRPADIFREAIVHEAPKLMLAHNHPSGDPAPSAQDLAFTRKLKEGGELIGVAVIDHVILGQGRFFSFRREGLLL